MLTFVATSLFILLIVLALYAFGLFDTPYLSAFRFAFYLVLVLLILTVGGSLVHHPDEGYDASTQTR
jgi:hypothetical protein